METYLPVRKVSDKLSNLFLTTTASGNGVPPDLFSECQTFAT